MASQYLLLKAIMSREGMQLPHLIKSLKTLVWDIKRQDMRLTVTLVRHSSQSWIMANQNFGRKFTK